MLLLKSIMWLGCAFHMEDVLTVLADKEFFYLVSILEHAGHFRLLYRWGDFSRDGGRCMSNGAGWD